MNSKKAENEGAKSSLKYPLEFLKNRGEFTLIYNKNIRLYFIAKINDNGAQIVSNLYNKKHDSIIEFNRLTK